MTSQSKWGTNTDFLGASILDLILILMEMEVEVRVVTGHHVYICRDRKVAAAEEMGVWLPLIPHFFAGGLVSGSFGCGGRIGGAGRNGAPRC